MEFLTVISRADVKGSDVRRLRVNDYIVAGFGIYGALQISGLTGKYVLFPRGYLLVVSMGIVFISAFLLVSKYISNILTPGDRRAYVIYIITNSFPSVVFWVRRILA